MREITIRNFTLKMRGKLLIYVVNNEKLETSYSIFKLERASAWFVAGFVSNERILVQIVNNKVHLYELLPSLTGTADLNDYE